MFSNTMEGEGFERVRVAGREGGGCAKFYLMHLFSQFLFLLHQLIRLYNNRLISKGISIINKK